MYTRRVPCRFLARMGARKLTRFWFRYATARDTNHQALVDTAMEAFDAGSAYPLATMLQLWRHGPADHQLATPALAVWGMQDRSHANTDPSCSRGHARNAEIIEFDHCGHFPELEDPEGFAGGIRPFLNACLGS